MPFTANRTIPVPGTLVNGYTRGQEVPESVVADWNLEVGQHGDVTDGTQPAPESTPVMTRPGEADTRATWEAWAVANGMSEEDAAQAGMDDLQAAGPQDRGAVADTTASDHPRPADSAKKAEWVMYVNDHPRATAEDQAWAGDDSTTKADLMAWQPGEPAVGDPVALAATEATNG